MPHDRNQSRERKRAERSAAQSAPRTAIDAPRVGVLTEPATRTWLWPALALIAAGAVVYANSLRGAFLFDDAYAIVDNQRVRNLWPITPLLATERPVVELSLALNYAWSKLNPLGYHLVNLAVHLTAGLALYGLVRRTLMLTVRDAGIGFRSSGSRFPMSDIREMLAFAVALLWLIHPLQTESVTYIIQRAESMMGLFCLLALYAFVRAAASQRRRWLVLSMAACALAMATKAVAVTLPVVVLLFDRCFFAGTLAEAIKRRWGHYLGLTATWSILFLCGIAQHVLAPATDRTAIGFGFKEFSSLQYALTQPAVILHYLRLSAWPYPLVLDYAWPVVKQVGDAIVPLAAIIALLAVTLWALWKNHWLGFVGAAFFLILAPTSSVIPVRDVAFEHRMYLPLAAVVVVAVALMAAVGRRVADGFGLNVKARTAVALALLAAACIPMAAATIQRNRDYHDALTMWRDVAAKRPANSRAHVNIGVLLERRGEVDAAIEAYRRALALKPDYADAHFNLGLALLRLDRWDEAEVAFRQAVRLAPDDPGPRANLGRILARKDDLEGAVSEYRAALKTAPDDADTRARLANALRRLGDVHQAAAEAQLAVQLAPHLPVAHDALAHVFLARGDTASAAAEFRRVVELDPTEVVARINLATSLKAEERFDEAIELYRQAIRIDPRSYYAHLHLAEAYLSKGLHDQAIAEFEAAVQFSPADADAHAGLGHALRAAGRVLEAAEHFRQALIANPNQRDARKALTELGVAPPP